MDNNLKTFILRVIEDHGRIRRNQISRIKTLDARVRKLNIQKDENLDFVPRRNTLGWLPEEKNIFRLLIMKFGSGKYTEYLEGNHLPFRSKQQISTQIQRLYNLQSIGFTYLNSDLSFKNTLESESWIKLTLSFQYFYRKKRY
eukprot:snap_masked-scaffold_39-processed-gene-1.46-mRNA-1 protein AED:1.00 eAED:1.00 QI:0/0/0/0/1/1/2/0/142